MAAFDVAVAPTTALAFLRAVLSQVAVCGIGWVVLHALVPRLLSMRTIEGWGWSALAGQAGWGVSCLILSHLGVRWSGMTLASLWTGAALVALMVHGHRERSPRPALDAPPALVRAGFEVVLTVGLLPVVVRLLAFPASYVDEYLWWGYHMQGLWHAGSVEGQTGLLTLAPYYPPLLPLGGLPAIYAAGGFHPLYIKVHVAVLLLATAAVFPPLLQRAGCRPGAALGWTLVAMVGAPVLLDFAGVFYADVPFAWWAGLGLGAAAVAMRRGPNAAAWWRLGGVMFGACALTKYEGVAALGAAALLPFLTQPRDKWMDAGVNFLAPAVGMALLWYPFVLDLQQSAPLRHTGGSPFTLWHWAIMLPEMGRELARGDHWAGLWIGAGLLVIAGRPWRLVSRRAGAVGAWLVLQGLAVVAMYATAPDADPAFYRLRIVTTFPRLLIHLVPGIALLLALWFAPGDARDAVTTPPAD